MEKNKQAAHVEVSKGDDEKCAVERRWEKRRNGRRVKDAEHAYAQTNVVGEGRNETWWG